MFRYALIPPASSHSQPNSMPQPQPSPRVIALSDDAHGADVYLAWRRKGFQLRRLHTQDGE